MVIFNYVTDDNLHFTKFFQYEHVNEKNTEFLLRKNSSRKIIINKYNIINYNFEFVKDVHKVNEVIDNKFFRDFDELQHENKNKILKKSQSYFLLTKKKFPLFEKL